RLYSAGDIASLNITIENKNNIDLQLYLKIQYNENFIVDNFNLSSNDVKSIIKNIPVDDVDNGRIDYFVYMDSGRSLHIDTVYLNIMPDTNLMLYTDKQVYSIGDIVDIKLNTADSGDLILYFLNNTYHDGSFTGGKTLTYEIPQLLSGTYYIDYTFKGKNGSYPIDIVGYYSRIVDFKTDKEVYNVLSNILIDSIIESNKNISGLMNISISNLYGEIKDSHTMNVDMIEGENKINATKTITNGIYGINKLILEIYVNLTGDPESRLIHAAKYFDVADGNDPSIQYVINLLNLIGSEDYIVSFDLNQDKNGEYVLTITGVDPNGNPFTRIERFNCTSGTVGNAYMINETRIFNSDKTMSINASEFDTHIDINVTHNISTEITITNLDNWTNSSFGLLDLGKFVKIEAPELNGFNAKIVMYYNDSDIESRGIDESSLRLWYYNTTTGWVVYDNPDGGVNTIENYVWANTDHFSTWSILGSPKTSQTNNQGGSGGGGGSGSQNVAAVNNVVVTDDGSVGSACLPDWKCSSWSRCINGKQTRSCVDNNKCNINTGKPAETNPCETDSVLPTKTENVDEVNEIGKESGLGDITGAIIGALTGKQGIGAFIILVIVIGGLLLFANYYGGLPGASDIERARIFHQRGQEYHKKGRLYDAEKNYIKAEKLREVYEQKMMKKIR
ncbi:MAG: hypothetical protein ABIJ08_00495, partial [Nanoarchaeota archaeon]